MLQISRKNQSKTPVDSLIGELKAQGSAQKSATSALTFDPSRFAAKATASKEQQIEKQVRNWVGESFYGTLLKQMRDDPFKSQMFDGGRGGEAYNQLFDQRLPQHMAGGVGSKLVRPMVRAMTRNKQQAAQSYGRQSVNRSQMSKEASHVSTDSRA